MNVLVYFLFSHFLKKKQFDLVLQFSFLLFCYQRSFLELLCEQCTHIQLNKKTNNNRPAAFYILIIVIPQCCSPVFAQGICFIWHVKGKIKKKTKGEPKVTKKKSHYQQSSGRKPDVTVMAELKTKLTHTTQGKSLPMINIIRAFQLKQNMHIVQTMIRLVGILSKVLLCSYLQCVNPH